MLQAVDHLVLVTSELDALREVTPKLVRAGSPPAKYKEAPDKMVKALEEMSKIYGAIEGEFSRYLALELAEPVDPHDKRDLVGLAGGETTARLGALRGHCGKIVTIYDRHLRPWFADTLSDEEQHRLEHLFRQRLHEFDGDMMDAIEELAGWITDQAAHTLDAVNRGQFEKANRRIHDASRDVLDGRRKLREAFNDLGRLQAEFMTVSD